MPVTREVLQGFRNRGYGGRILDLTPEERASVQGGEGEICLAVYGILSDKGFEVSKVVPDEDVSSEGPPSRAMPSPS